MLRTGHSLIISSSERQKRDKARKAQFRIGSIFRKASKIGARGKGKDDARIIQDPDIFVQKIGELFTPANVSDAAFAFVSHSVHDDADIYKTNVPKGAKKDGRYTRGLANLNAASAANKDRVLAIFTDTYVLEPVPYMPTSSLMAPTLRWATTKDSDVKIFIDNTKRIVVKMYPLGSIITEFVPKSASAADELNRELAPLVDLVNDICLSYYLTSLVRDYDHVVTPHFAFPIDWFIGPMIDGDHIKPIRNPDTGKLLGMAPVEVKADSLAQYVVVERADVTLSELMKSPSLSVRLMRSLIWQTLHALESAWLMKGYVHYDAHSSNIMVRYLLNELESPYLNRTWAYKRASEKDFYYLTLQDHGHMFVEIIDAGRSRAFVTLDSEEAGPDGNKPLHLVGYPMLEEFGIFVNELDNSGPDTRVDRSWDVRRLGIDLMLELDIDAMVARQYEGVIATTGTTTGTKASSSEVTLASELKDLIGHMVGGMHFVRAIVAVIQGWAPESEPRNNAEKAAWKITSSGQTALWELLSEACNALVNRTRTPSNLAVFVALETVIKKARKATWFYKNLFFDVFLQTLLFNYILNPATNQITLDRDLHATSCISHALFQGLNSSKRPVAEMEAIRQSALVVGFVAQRDILADPFRGTYHTKEEEKEDTSVDELNDDACRTTLAPIKRGRPSLRRSILLNPVPVKCVACGLNATGYAMPERSVPYCSNDCVWGATGM
jgi:hypothetical protein